MRKSGNLTTLEESRTGEASGQCANHQSHRDTDALSAKTARLNQCEACCLHRRDSDQLL